MDEYWSVDLPGLTYDEASRLLAWAQANKVGIGGSLVDPARTFTRHLDHATTEALHAAVAHYVATAAEHSQDAARTQILRGVAEDLDDWLRNSPAGDGPLDGPRSKA